MPTPERVSVKKYYRLCDAIKKEDVYRTRKLLQYNIPLNLPYSVQNNISLCNDTPLNLSVKKNKEEFVELLLNKGARIGKELSLLIHEAILNNNCRIVKLLIEHETQINNSIDLTKELSTAVEQGNPSIVQHIHPYYRGTNKLIPKIAILKYGPKYEKCIQILLDHGFTVVPKDRDMRPFMHSLLISGDEYKIFNTLLTHGVDVNLVNYKTGYTLLHTACLQNCMEKVQLLLNLNANINAKVVEGDGTNLPEHVRSKRLFGKTPLFIAVDRGDFAMTKFMLTNGGNIQDTPDILITAVQTGSLKIIQLLLDYGANINATNSCGKTPLHYCASTFPARSADDIKSEIVKLLLRNGANVNAKTQSGITPLFIATEYGYTKVVQVLLENGADFLLVNKYGHTLLHIASEKGYTNIVDILLKVIKENGRKMILDVVSKGKHVRIFEELLKFNTNIDCVDENGKTLLHSAFEGQNVEIIEILLNYETDVNAKDRNGQSPLHIGSKIENANTECVKTLLSFNIDVNVADNNGKTALHLAAIAKNWGIVEALAKHNANVNIKDKDGLTAFHHTVKAETNDIGCIVVLLNHDANINAIDNDNNTPLHFACKNRNQDVVNCLLKHNANVNMKNKDGKTPLHIACEINKFDESDGKFVNLLLVCDAYVDSVDINGDTPLHYAVRSCSLEVIQELIKVGANINIRNNNNETTIDCAMRKGGMTFLSFSMLKIMQFLKQHIIKLKFAKLNVCKQIFDLISERKEDWLETFENTCKEEIKKMKIEKFANSYITYYEFLTRDVNYTINLIKNENLMLALQSSELNRMFPLYSDILKTHFAESQRRNHLLKLVRRYISLSIFASLPDNCINEIFGYLDIEELEMFINVIKPAFIYYQ